MKKNRAAILAIGNEILEGQIFNRHAQVLSAELSSQAFEVVAHMTVKDSIPEICEALDYLSGRTDAVICTGGLGPMTEDLTRQALAEWTEQKLVESQESLERLKEKLHARNVSPRPSHLLQVLFPETCEIFVNHVGTAEGFGVIERGVAYVALPGPAPELHAVWHEGGAGAWLLRHLRPDHSRQTHHFTFLGVGEAAVADQIEELFKGKSVELGYRVHPPFVEVKVYASRESQSDIDACLEQIPKLSGFYFHGASDPLVAFQSNAQRFQDFAVIDLTQTNYLSERMMQNAPGLAFFRGNAWPVSFPENYLLVQWRGDESEVTLGLGSVSKVFRNSRRPDLPLRLSRLCAIEETLAQVAGAMARDGFNQV